MYQQEIFTNPFRDWDFVGDGFTAVVHAKGDWVIKKASYRDMTLNYLEWCVMRRNAGNPMRGMPEIDALVHTENGYIVTMRRYDDEDRDGGRMCRRAYGAGGDYDNTPYMGTLIYAFLDYLADVFGEYYDACDMDLHKGNHMWDDDNESWILTDPSEKPYLDTPYVEGFKLQ